MVEEKSWQWFWQELKYKRVEGNSWKYQRKTIIMRDLYYWLVLNYQEKMWDLGKHRRSFPDIFMADQSSCARRTCTISFNSPSLPENTFIHTVIITIVCGTGHTSLPFLLLVRLIHTFISHLSYQVIIVPIAAFLSTTSLFLQDLQNLL